MSNTEQRNDAVSIVEEAIERLRQAHDLEAREVHVGFENGMTSGAYVYADYLPAADVFAIVHAAITKLKQANASLSQPPAPSPLEGETTSRDKMRAAMRAADLTVPEDSDGFPKEMSHRFLWETARDAALAALSTEAGSGEVRYRQALEAIQKQIIAGQVCDDVAWFDKFTTLLDFVEEALRPSAPAAVADLFSTPTAQPPAAETRLRELTDCLKWALPLAERAVDDHRLERVRCGHNNIHGTYKNGVTWAGIYQSEVDQIERARAALTQPEPTAQQATWLRGYLVDGHFCTEISDIKYPEAHKIEALYSVPSAQQAAGEVEAVAWLYTNDAGDKELLLDGRIESARRLLESGYTEQALYATPQPTETQRIVASGDEDAKRLSDNFLGWVANRLERGEHLAGEGQ